MIAAVGATIGQIGINLNLEQANTNQNTASSTQDYATSTSRHDCVYRPSNRSSKQYPDYCPHRLPCGYCKILFTDCPKGYATTWTVTC